MKNLNKNTENINKKPQLKKYVMFTTKKNTRGNEPIVLFEKRKHKIIDNILSSGNVDFIIDEGYPSYSIELKSDDGLSLTIDQDHQFGLVSKGIFPNDSVQDLVDAYLIFCDPAHTIYHIFIFENGFHQSLALLEELKKGTLDNLIISFLGEDHDVVSAVRIAIINEREHARVNGLRLFQHYYKLRPATSGPFSYPQIMDCEGYYSALNPRISPNPTLMRFDNCYESNYDFTLILKGAETLRFQMENGFGLLSDHRNKRPGGETILVYHNLKENAFEFFVTRENLPESPLILFNMFKCGELTLEIARILGPERRSHIRDWDIQFAEFRALNSSN